MQITYTYENLNLLIVLLGIIVIIHIVTLKKIESRTIKFANYELLKRVIGYEVLRKNYLPLFLRLMAMFLIIVAMSNLTLVAVTYISDSDYVFAIDSSSSMLTSENGTFMPSKLENAKESALSLLDKMPAGTSVGLVTFAGKSYVREELTDDRMKMKDALHAVTFEEAAGTAIGDALIASAGLLTNTSKKKVMAIITDGQSNKGISVDESLKYVMSENITVYTIGVGLNHTITNDHEFDVPLELLGTNATTFEYQQLNETELRHIANMTSGKYFFVTSRDELDKAFESVVLQSDTAKIPLAKYVLLLATLLLLIEWGIGVTKYKTIP